MNTKESLALFAKGKETWNEWANRMLAERAALKAAGKWVEGPVEPDWNDETRVWHAAAEARFSRYTFEECANFSGFVFPGDASFDKATFVDDARFGEAIFTGYASFYEATFTGYASFDKATFSGYASFDKATFSGGASFGKATFADMTWFNRTTFSHSVEFLRATFADDVWFSEAIFTGYASFYEATFAGHTSFNGATFADVAWFSGATFTGTPWFTRALFEGFTTFDHAKFESSAGFPAIEAKSVFSLAGVTFLAVPDFIQAHFAEAPRLDDSRIEPRRFRLLTVSGMKESFWSDPDLAARWRALKRLAIQGHDHARELMFFERELKARRWNEDKPWHAVFWFGIFYQMLSGFGRSIWLPLCWWALSVFGFAGLYLGQHPLLAKESLSGIGWAFQRLTGSSGEAPPLTCVAGQGEPWLDALYLSLHKGLLSLSQVPANKLNEFHACLYGIHTADAAQPSQLPDSFSPVIPDGITAFGFLQHPLSAVLIFLFLLAIRNHFRIK